jgi:hypothetical protein
MFFMYKHVILYNIFIKKFSTNNIYHREIVITNSSLHICCTFLVWWVHNLLSRSTRSKLSYKVIKNITASECRTIYSLVQCCELVHKKKECYELCIILQHH